MMMMNKKLSPHNPNRGTELITAADVIPTPSLHDDSDLDVVRIRLCAMTHEEYHEIAKNGGWL